MTRPPQGRGEREGAPGWAKIMKRIFTHIEGYESSYPIQAELKEVLSLCKYVHVGIGEYQNIITFFITGSEWYETILTAEETRQMAKSTTKNIYSEVI